MEKNRLEKGIDVINYAIEKGISVKAASVACGYSDTYVKNAKAKVYKAFEEGVLDINDFNRFKNAIDKYLNSRTCEIYTKQPKVKRNTVYEDMVLGNMTNAAKGYDLPSFDELKGLTNNGKTIVSGNDKTIDIEWKTTSYPDGHIKTVDELLKKANVDTDIWKVKDFVINKWDVTSFKNDFPQTIENFQVKARLEKDQKAQNVKSSAEIFAEMCKTYTPPVFKQIKKNPNLINENNLFEVNIFDLHLGKLCWNGETHEDYDSKIASERFMYSINTLMERANGFNYSRVLFPVGNDFFNSDTMLNTTTSGTPVDNDLRWQKTFSIGCKLIVDGIELLKTTGVPVDVLMIPGNHDFERNYYLGSFLEAWFRNDDMVNIDNHASPRKYYNFGKCLLGFTHGSEEKIDSLAMLMSVDSESKQFWSTALFKEYHVGHLHRKITKKYSTIDKSDIVKEDLGVTVRFLSSLSGSDSWHNKKGFIGSNKGANAFLWNSENGLVAEITSNYIVK